MKNEIAKRVKGAALTKSQRKIAEYMVRNEDRIGSMSAMEIAREIRERCVDHPLRPGDRL